MSHQELEARSEPSPGETGWWSALTLRERARATPAARSSAGTDGLSERALIAYKKWCAQPPFNDDRELLDERLDALGLTADDLPGLLEESPRELAARIGRAPAWQVELDAAYAPHSSWDGPAEGFLALVHPLVERGAARLRREIANLAAEFPLGIDAESVEKSLKIPLYRELNQLVGRTAVLELNVARLEGTLTAETAQARFEEFARSLGDLERACRLLTEYPVLARLITERVDQWAGHSLSLLTDLVQDWADIRRRMPVPAGTSALTEVLPGLGDRHGGGRSVSLLRFDSGFRLVYKPRSLSVDANFQHLLEWVGRHDEVPGLRTLSMVDAGDHGWMEFVESRPCESADEVRDFYRRQGTLLCLLHVLHAVDVHFENIIAAGPHPVLVDLETLFHPNHWTIGTQGAAPANTAIGESVMETGLLPRRKYFAGDDEDAGTETSGLGGPMGQRTPYAVPYWVRQGSDEMRLERGRQTIIDVGANRPTLRGAEVDATAHMEEVIEGFTAAYRLLAAAREELLAPGGPIERFKNDRVRLILRPTATYALSLVESYHPDVLRDALDRDRLFDHLWTPRQRNSVRAAVCSAEHRDLTRDDIPLFTMSPSTRHVWDSDGIIFRDLLDRPVMASVHDRVRAMGEDDLARQVWFIRASFTALSAEPEPTSPHRRLSPAGRPATRQELLSAAVAVGDRLAELSLRTQDAVDWVSLNLVNQRSWALGPAGNDLYFGQWGIALALGYLGAVTGEPGHTALARRVVEHVLRHLTGETGHDHHGHGSTLQENLGAFHSGPGAVYTLTHLGALWDDPSLTDRALETAGILARGIGADTRYDILSGTAGLLCVLLGLYERTKDENVLRYALDCGDHLLKHATPMERGLAWFTPRFGSTPLAGFSHGAGGVAHALIRLYSITGVAAYARAAEQAMAYERSLFSPAVGNWPDLREQQQPQAVTQRGELPYMTAWCHGAPGVGLARATALRAHLFEETARDELEIAVRTTLGQKLVRDDSLCHGSLGNLDFLSTAASVLDRAELREQVLDLASGLLGEAAGRGWKCGSPGAVETPGLMTGLAGICHGLLRLAEPDLVPSVLTLAPPTAAEHRPAG
ncbi:type 2 lanthipeptide synthetase LanM family protein [Nonomuraea wenchangensis]